uniref:VWFA domain-containing protein n=1 Tax=Acrobeloides nanus TaxID=290746 RepID=A0A914E823_9BILA
MLHNFTNTLPFNDSNFHISLLSFGTKSGPKVLGPFSRYDLLCEAIQEEWKVSEKHGLYDAKLNDTLWTYWYYILNGQDIENFKCSDATYCLNKLVLFTAIDDVANIKEAINISNKINEYGRIIAIEMCYVGCILKPSINIFVAMAIVSKLFVVNMKDNTGVIILQDVYRIVVCIGDILAKTG